MARRKPTEKYIIEGKGGALFELDELSPQIARQLERGEVVLLEAPSARDEPAEGAGDESAEG